MHGTDRSSVEACIEKRLQAHHNSCVRVHIQKSVPAIVKEFWQKKPRIRCCADVSIYSEWLKTVCSDHDNFHRRVPAFEQSMCFFYVAGRDVTCEKKEFCLGFSLAIPGGS